MQRGQPCEIVVELFALFLDIFKDGSDHPDNGNDETAKGNCAQVKDLPRMNIGRKGKPKSEAGDGERMGKKRKETDRSIP